MGSFLAAVLSYPTVIYTTLLSVVLVYWLIAMTGLIDIDSGPDLDIDMDVDMDLDVDADLDVDHTLNMDGEPRDIGTLASYLIALGLGGVPFSIVISLLVLSSWTISSIAALWIMPFIPTTVLQLVVGTVILIGAFLLSLPIAAFFVRPMRKLFVSHSAISNASLVGRPCKVLTGSVDEKFGRAEVPARGAGYHIRVVADTPNTLKRGSNAIIVEYDETASHYWIREIE